MAEKDDKPIDPSEFHEADKILFAKQHESDRFLERKFDEIHAITRALETECSDENISRYEKFDKEVDVAISIMEADNENEDLLNLDEYDYAFIKKFEQELLVHFFTMKRKAKIIIDNHSQ